MEQEFVGIMKFHMWNLFLHHVWIKLCDTIHDDKHVTDEWNCNLQQYIKMNDRIILEMHEGYSISPNMWQLTSWKSCNLYCTYMNQKHRNVQWNMLLVSNSYIRWLKLFDGISKAHSYLWHQLWISTKLLLFVVSVYRVNRPQIQAIMQASLINRSC